MAAVWLSASVSLNRTVWMVPASPHRMRRRRLSWSGQSESYKWSGDGLESSVKPNIQLASHWSVVKSLMLETNSLVYLVKYAVTFELNDKANGIKVKCLHLILSGRNNRIDETVERRIGMKSVDDVTGRVHELKKLSDSAGLRWPPVTSELPPCFKQNFLKVIIVVMISYRSFSLLVWPRGSCDAVNRLHLLHPPCLLFCVYSAMCVCLGTGEGRLSSRFLGPDH